MLKRYKLLGLFMSLCLILSSGATSALANDAVYLFNDGFDGQDITTFQNNTIDGWVLTGSKVASNNWDTYSRYERISDKLVITRGSLKSRYDLSATKTVSMSSSNVVMDFRIKPVMLIAPLDYEFTKWNINVYSSNVHATNPLFTVSMQPLSSEKWVVSYTPYGGTAVTVSEEMEIATLYDWHNFRFMIDLTAHTAGIVMDGNLLSTISLNNRASRITSVQLQIPMTPSTSQEGGKYASTWENYISSNQLLCDYAWVAEGDNAKVISAAYDIVFANTDSVISDFDLPMQNGEVNFTWVSSHPCITIDDTLVPPKAVVTQPSWGEDSQDGFLSVIAECNGIQYERIFPMTVPAGEPEDAVAVSSVLEALTVPNPLKENLPNSGLYHTTITWESTNPQVLAPDGTLTRPTASEGDAIVTLTATVTRGGVSQSKVFENIIVPLLLSDTAAVTAVAEQLNLEQEAEAIKSMDAHARSISTLYLPEAGNYETNITWRSDKPGISISRGRDGFVGTINRPTWANGPSTVTLTATVQKNDASVTKDFRFTVPPVIASFLNGDFENELGFDSYRATVSRIENVDWGSTSLLPRSGNWMVKVSDRTDNVARWGLRAKRRTQPGEVLIFTACVAGITPSSSSYPMIEANGTDAPFQQTIGSWSKLSDSEGWYQFKGYAIGGTDYDDGHRIMLTVTDAALGSYYVDDFTGELPVVGEIAIVGEDKILIPNGGTTTVTKTYSAQVLNQIGTTNGLESYQNVMWNTSALPEGVTKREENGNLILEFNNVSNIGEIEITAMSDSDIDGSVWVVGKKTIRLMDTTMQDALAISLGDIDGYVVSDLKLPLRGASGSSITWTSDSPQYLSNSGVLTRPTASEGEKQVVLTATVQNGGTTYTRSFELLVLPELSGTASRSFTETYDDNVVPTAWFSSGAGLTVSDGKLRFTPFTNTSGLFLRRISDGVGRIVVSGELTATGKNWSAVLGGTLPGNAITLKRVNNGLYAECGEGLVDLGVNLYRTPTFRFTIEADKNSQTAQITINDESTKTVTFKDYQKDFTMFYIRLANDATAPVELDFLNVTGISAEMMQAEADLVLQESDNLTANITLPQTSASGVNVTWTSSNPNLIEVSSDQKTLIVKRPASAVSQSVSVTLCIRQGDVELTKEFHFRVPGVAVIIGGAGGSGGGGSGGGFGGGSGGISNISLPQHTEQESLLIEKEGFHDIDDVLWAQESILALYDKGVINGVDKHTFEPNRNIKLEEFVKMVVLAFGLQPGTKEIITFSDAEKDQWYSDYISIAQTNGLILGKDDGTIGIGTNISREQIAVISHRICELKRYDIAADKIGYLFVDDTDISFWAKDGVYAMQKGGIINGTGNGKFEPKRNATRAETAKIIYMLRLEVLQ